MGCVIKLKNAGPLALTSQWRQAALLPNCRPYRAYKPPDFIFDKYRPVRPAFW